MVCIILCASRDAEERAVQAGFTEQTVLIRYDPVQSTDANKKALEREVANLRPFQYLVADYWGMEID